jgi:hypothetical protein
MNAWKGSTQDVYDQQNIPVETLNAIDRYVFARLPPGDFLEAVLSNNLQQTFNLADTKNREVLPAIVAYVFNHTPPQCRGNPERVDQWLNS